MASVIDCFVAKGQRRACKDGEEGGGRLWDARGSLLALGLCHGGASASLGKRGAPSRRGKRRFPLHRHPLATDPPRASVSPPADWVVRLCGGWQHPGLCGWGKKRWGLQGRVCAHGREVEVGSVGVGGGLCTSVCSQEGWDGQGEGSVFPGRSSEAAFELVCAFPMEGGDGDCAGRWYWSHSRDNTIPRALQLLGTSP